MEVTRTSQWGGACSQREQGPWNGSPCHFARLSAFGHMCPHKRDQDGDTVRRTQACIRRTGAEIVWKLAGWREYV